jgi:hypothetical protein
MDSDRITEVLQLAADPKTNETDKKALIEMLLTPLNEAAETMRSFLSGFFFHMLEKEPDKVIPVLLPLFVFLHQKQWIAQLRWFSP